MDAPPEHEDIGPFLTVAGTCSTAASLPPRPLAIDREQGLLLLEDFGDDRVGPLLSSASRSGSGRSTSGGRHPRPPRRPPAPMPTAAL
jgi:aminoglycoside/choline kinase family phosphotransferase